MCGSSFVSLPFQSFMRPHHCWLFSHSLRFLNIFREVYVLYPDMFGWSVTAAAADLIMEPATLIQVLSNRLLIDGTLMFVYFPWTLGGIIPCKIGGISFARSLWNGGVWTKIRLCRRFFFFSTHLIFHEQNWKVINHRKQFQNRNLLDIIFRKKNLQCLSFNKRSFRLSEHILV